MTSNVFCSVDAPRILWMDDQPGFLSNARRILSNEGFDLNISEAATIADASDMLKTGKYCAFVADCRMSDYEPAAQNGAEFLLEVNHLYRSLPTFVYSAHLEDALYADRVAKSNAILLEDKTRKLPKQLKSDRFFVELSQRAAAYQAVMELQPELIQYRDYLSQPSRYQKQVDAHWQKHGVWITKELTRNKYEWGVVCGDQIVSGSDDLFLFPDEAELMEIGARHNLIPFAYSLPRPPETIEPAWSWKETATSKDFYPCMRLRLTELIIDDFDTGASQSHVSEELVDTGFLDAIRSNAEGIHLGQSYRSITKKITVSLQDDSGQERSAKLPVCIVKDWSNSPFVAINRNRKMLIGRDILRAFNIELTLNSMTRKSSIKFVDDPSEADDKVYKR